MIKFISKVNSKKLILFIHGFMGGEDTWVNNDNQHFGNLLSSGEILDKYNIAEFVYYTKISDNTVSKFFFRLFWPHKSDPIKKAIKIGKISELLKTEILVTLRDYEEIIIIAHSMGGLVTKSYILNCLKEQLEHRCALFISLAVPHKGSNKAVIGSVIIKNKQLSELQPNSKFITDLDNEWNSHKKGLLPRTIYIRGQYDTIVEEESSTPFSPKFVVEHDHTTISKPKDRNDLIVTIIERCIFQNEVKSLSYTTPDQSTINSIISSNSKLFDKKSQVEADNIEITTQYWLGNFKKAIIQADHKYHMALKDKNPELALLYASNKAIIMRGRGQYIESWRTLRDAAQSIRITELTDHYKIRFLKELFVIKHETNRIEEAALCLKTIKRIDKNRYLYTPGDDWLPGVILWRESHLAYLSSSSGSDIRRALDIAHESYDYFENVGRYNNNLAGQASATLNLGWLYFAINDKLCMDYFEEASEKAKEYSPRTYIESLVARNAALVYFNKGGTSEISALEFYLRELSKNKYPIRNYSFLKGKPSPYKILFKYKPSCKIKL